MSLTSISFSYLLHRTELQPVLCSVFFLLVLHQSLSKSFYLQMKQKIRRKSIHRMQVIQSFSVKYRFKSFDHMYIHTDDDVSKVYARVESGNHKNLHGVAQSK